MKNLQNIIFSTLTLFALLSYQNVQAQFTTFQQDPDDDSDYFYNIEWNLDIPSCDCIDLESGFIWVYQDDISGNPTVIETIPGTTSDPWPGSQQFSYHPGYTPDTRFDYHNSSALNAFGGPCSFPCFGVIQSTPAPMGPLPLKNVENFEITRLDDGSVKLTWDVITDIPEANYELHIRESPGLGGTGFNPIVSKGVTEWIDPSCPQIGEHYFIHTRYVGTIVGDVLTSEEQLTYTQEIHDANQPPGKISGTVVTKSCSGEAGVTIKATLMNPEDLSNVSCWPSEYEVTTVGSSGNYTIPNMYVGVGNEMAEYNIEAFLPAMGNSPVHQFRNRTSGGGCPYLEMDSVRTVVLGSTSAIATDESFIDITSFAITGNVSILTSLPAICGLDSVVISTSPGNSLPSISDGNGDYVVIVDESGVYELTATYNGEVVEVKSVTVDDAPAMLDFSYTKTDTLKGFIGAGCQEVIGQMTLESRTRTGCPIASTTTNPSGYYELVMPSIPMDVQIVGYDPQNSGLDSSDVFPKIDSIYEINHDSTFVLDIQYRKPIKINVEGLPPPPCPSVNYPVLNQDQEYTITINIWEEIDICRADTGSVMISDDASTFGIEDPIVTEVPFANGRLQYTIRAGDPALSAPFLKYLNITAFVDNEIETIPVAVIVSGTRIKTSTITSAPSDSIPFMILRDPPGDGSQAWFSENNTTSYNQSFSHEVGGSVKIWAKARPSIFGAVWGEIAGSLEVGGTRKSSTESTVTLETTTEIKTKATNAFIGEDGDLVMGAAINFKYGLSDDRFFDLNTCSIVVDTSLVFSPETFESTYIHSVSFIKSDIIPKLDFLSQNQDTTEEARRKFASRLRVWEQILQLNRDQKEEALKTPITTFSFDAGAEQTSTITGSSSKQSSLEFTTNIDAEIAVSAGVKLIAFEGSAGVDVNIRSSWGNSKSFDTLMSTTTGYTFSDDDPGDSHYFDYAIDPVYGTPVFGVLGGASSCPHEEITQFIDLMKLTVASPIFVGGPAEDLAIFQYTAQNLGETGATNTYMLDFIEQSNPNSAIVTVNGSMQPVLIELTPGAVATGEIRVTRPAGDQYTFEGLQFDFFAACLAGGNPFPDKSIKSTAYVSAYFMNDCSGINLTAPSNNWLINQQSGNMVQVTMDDYVLGNIDNVKLMYANQKDGLWYESNINIPGPNLVAPPQNYMWDISDLVDGNYTIRWELTCGPTLNWSPRVTGKIDRTKPRVFGVEKPVTDVYFPGDEISVQFNEEIDFTILNNTHIYLKLIPQGTFHPVTLDGAGNEVVLTLQESIDSMYNQTFEVGVFGIVDLYGNAKTDTAIWEFVVSEPDSDRDGVGDLTDRCPGGDDNQDTDMDGLPDDCDCVPTIPSNGRELTKAALDFDGVDDHITIPHHTDMIPTSTNTVTIEAWIYPVMSDNVQRIITQSGSFPNRNHVITIFSDTKKVGVTGNGVSLMSSISMIPDDKWTHLAVVFNLNETIIYINGVLDNTRIQTLSATDDGLDIAIGSQASGGPSSNNWEGKMDEVRYWGSALTLAQINERMNIELEGNETGLVAYYDFNEGTPFGDNTDLSTIVDKSMSGHDGTLLNAQQTGSSSNWVPSPVSALDVAYDICRTCTDTLNTAMDFDGINDKISIPNNPMMVPTSSNSMTCETWIYRDGPSSGLLVHSDSNLYVAFNSFGGIQVITGPVNTFRATPNGLIELGKWSHIAVVFEPDSLKVYLNGVLKLSVAQPHDAPFIANPISLGGRFSNNDFQFDGKMDDVRFWDHARTEQQINNHLYTELKGDEAGLVAYYNFNEGLPSQNNETLSMAADVTANGNVGTLLNFNQFGMFSNWVKSPLRFSGDADEDGRPDVCDGCIPEINLLLENVSLNGIYRARDKITLGNGVTFPANAQVIFRTPVLELFDSVDAQPGVEVLVIPETCEEE